jgi:hypothetical protein
MKLVTFQVNGPVGAQRRLGAQIEDQRVVDLTTQVLRQPASKVRGSPSHATKYGSWRHCRGRTPSEISRFLTST